MLEWLNRFLERLENYVDLRELGFDFSIILGLYFLDFDVENTYLVFKHALSLFGPWSIVVGILFTEFSVSILIGNIVKDFSDNAYSRMDRMFYKISFWIAAFSVLFLYLVPPAFSYNLDLAGGEVYFMAAFIGGIFVILSGIMIGSGAVDIEGDYSMGVFVLMIPLLFIGIYLSIYIGKKFGWFAGVVAFLLLESGIALAMLGISTGVNYVISYIKENPFLSKLSSFFVYFLLSIGFSWWQWMGVLTFKETDIGIIGSLVFTGILPFRIIMSVAPPRRILSILSGVFMIALDIMYLKGSFPF